MTDLLEERLEQQSHRRGARAVRDNEQHAFVAVVIDRAGLCHRVGDLIGGDEVIRGGDGGEEVAHGNCK